ncbi:MAG: glycosyltransferase family 4 protein [Caulobacteraceae bacterium]|nr:glycosyltransferase family 4 protein [Caulobacteraceae bacterium]
MTRVLFEVGRLIGRRDRGAPTGVDRVCLAYDRWLRGLQGVTLVPVHTTRRRMTALEPRWVAESLDEVARRWSGEPMAAPSAEEARLRRALTGARPVRSLMGRQEDAEPGQGRRTVERLLRTRPLPELRKGDRYIDVGHAPLDGPYGLARLRSHGVKSFVMIHDLIPVSHPEYCRPGEGPRHRSRVRAALVDAAGVIANSATTAGALERFAEQERLTPPPIVATPLGLEPVFAARRWSPDVDPYLVCIGTLEARKNLAFLLTVWRRLAERLGPVAPRLALIGRHGWENEAILDHLERSPPLQGLVHHAAELPDAALARLMAGARSVLAPSAVEGFDLPALEALALGVPVIASDIPVHRELARGARLVDPLDGPGWAAAIEAACAGPVAGPSFAAPTWAEHFALVAKLAGLPEGR